VERSLAISAESPLHTPAGLWRQLGLGETVPPQVRVAVNQAFAALDQPLQPGDEVAFLPPISGG
jgi:sulfur-carrier protein